jgi:activator of 2-hydroxyglutaryl-CoA dehydratase
MIRRVGVEERFVFAGGVANNPCLQQLFATSLGLSLSVPPNPQTVGALGAALYAASTQADT